MNIQICDHRDKCSYKIDLNNFERVIQELIENLELPPGDVEVNLVTPETIQTLNRDYRHIDKPANVLSFPHYNWNSPQSCAESIPELNSCGPPLLLGEVFLSVDTIFHEALAQGLECGTELFRMCIHGILHIVGYSHDTEKEFIVMNSIEEKTMHILKNQKFR